MGFLEFFPAPIPGRRGKLFFTFKKGFKGKKTTKIQGDKLLEFFFSFFFPKITQKGFF